MTDIGKTYSQTNDWQGERWHELLELYFRSGLDRNKIKSLIDLGCGTGERTKECLKYFPALEKVIGIDAEESMLEVAKKKNCDPQIEYKNLPIEQVETLSPRIFDAILGNYSLHWVKDKEKMVEKINSLSHIGSAMLVGTCTKLPILLQAIDDELHSQLKIKEPSPFFYLNLSGWTKLFTKYGWHLTASHISKDQHTVARGEQFLSQWFASSSGKALYGKSPENLEKGFVEKLLKKLDKAFLNSQGEWQFIEETLLIVAERVK